MIKVSNVAVWCTLSLLKLIAPRNVKRRRRACASLNFDAPRYLHGEDGFLRDSEERRGASENKDEEPEEDVHGHVGGAQVRGEPRKEERDEAADPLHDEHYDGGDAHPRVQAVNVGSNRIVRQKTIKSHIFCVLFCLRDPFSVLDIPRSRSLHVITY